MLKALVEMPSGESYYKVYWLSVICVNCGSKGFWGFLRGLLLSDHQCPVCGCDAIFRESETKPAAAKDCGVKVEIEETFQGSELVRRTANGIDLPVDYESDFVPPKECLCASFFTIRNCHKPGCPLHQQNEEVENNGS